MLLSWGSCLFPSDLLVIQHTFLQTEVAGIGKDNLRGQNAVDVAVGFFYQLQVDGFVYLLTFEFRTDASLPDVIGLGDGYPVLELVIGGLQVSAGGLGGFFDIQPFVDFPVYP